MKIAELKQPYRRMAEYLADKNTNTFYNNKEVLYDAFNWEETDYSFWLKINQGHYPGITDKIEKHFPDDFNLSGEEVENLKKENMSFFDKENQRKIEDENLQKAIYTQLAKEGKFDELPDTCEFSEPVELEVTGESGDLYIRKVYGKFKGTYVLKNHLSSVRHAQLPTPKIDFSDYKIGDVVEVVSKANGVYFGLICNTEKDFIKLSFNAKATTTSQIPITEIFSIKKLK